MAEYFHSFYNPQTGSVDKVPFTEEEITEFLAKHRRLDPVTPRQARLALYAAGLLEQVETVVAASDKSVQLTWEYAVEFRRDDLLINSLGKGLGLTDKQIDNLFIEASKL